jgi:hypothetical protein
MRVTLPPPSTGLPLCAPVGATVQRMEPGQFAGPHTDRPLLGSRGGAARLFLQLGKIYRVDPKFAS